MRARRFTDFLLLSTFITTCALMAAAQTLPTSQPAAAAAIAGLHAPAAAQTAQTSTPQAQTPEKAPQTQASTPAAAQGAPRQPARTTETVANDPDDPAIWRHPTDPARSLIIGTDKMAGTGGLYVFDLEGKTRQRIAPLDRPNNVDVEYGLRVNGRAVDIAVVTERKQHRLRVFAIRPDAAGATSGAKADAGPGAAAGASAEPLVDLAPAGIPVLGGETGARSEPMGIALYKRPRDGAIFAIVAPKTGGATDYLWQYRLEDDGKGGVKGTRVRRFGAFSGIGPTPGEEGEIEAVTVDDTLGFVYYSDERFGIRKWHADPDHPDAARELAVFGTDGYAGDREGLGIYAGPNGTGFIVSSDQVPGGTRLHFYPREGAAGRPHDHARVAVVPTTADETDGLEVTAGALPGFPDGLVVMMNSGPKNFQLYRWRDVAPVR